MSRKEFSATVKKQAYDRSKGLCGACQQPLQPGKIEYDHVLPDALGGKPVLANCLPMCKACHKIKTSTGDVPRIRKADRQGKAHINATRPTQKINSPKFAPALPQAKASRPVDKKAPEPKPSKKFDVGLARRPMFIDK